jgi:hypothetical protein
VSSFDADEWVSEVEQTTLMMRRAKGAPIWSDLRHELRNRGVDPEETLLVESYEDESDEVGAVVSRGGRVLAYRVQSGDWTWSDISDGWRESEFSDQVQVGLAMLGRDS